MLRRRDVDESLYSVSSHTKQICFLGFLQKYEMPSKSKTLEEPHTVFHWAWWKSLFLNTVTDVCCFLGQADAGYLCLDSAKLGGREAKDGKVDYDRLIQ